MFLAKSEAKTSASQRIANRLTPSSGRRAADNPDLSFPDMTLLSTFLESDANFQSKVNSMGQY